MAKLKRPLAIAKFSEQENITKEEREEFYKLSNTWIIVIYPYKNAFLVISRFRITDYDYKSFVALHKSKSLPDTEERRHLIQHFEKKYGHLLQDIRLFESVVFNPITVFVI